MRTDCFVYRVVLACAILLLSAPMTPRTSWVGLPANEMGGGTGGMRHSAGWEWVALLCGIAALAAVVFGLWARPAPVAPSVGAAVAAVAFLAAGLAAGGHWWDGVSGRLAEWGYVTYPAPAAPFFAIVGLLGAVLALALAADWFRTRQGILLPS
jgi:hypothetical protein